MSKAKKPDAARNEAIAWVKAQLMGPKKAAQVPRRPLQIGDRVSFEGYPFGSSAHVEGRGTLTHVLGKTAAVLPDNASTEHHIFGLRSFRRLVKRGSK
jgi:hypothetical protein